MTTTTPMCLWCRRYQKDGTCTSFPKGIPDDIIWDGKPHYESRAGELAYTPSDAYGRSIVEEIWGPIPVAKAFDPNEHPRDQKGRFGHGGVIGGIASDAPKALGDNWGTGNDGTVLSGMNAVTGQPSVLWFEQVDGDTFRQYNSDPNSPDSRCHYDTMKTNGGVLSYKNTVDGCGGANNEINYDPPITLMPTEWDGSEWKLSGQSAAVYTENGSVTRRGTNSWTAEVLPETPTHVRTIQTTRWEDGSVTHWQEDYWLGEVPRAGGGSAPGIVRSAGGNTDVDSGRWDITFDRQAQV